MSDAFVYSNEHSLSKILCNEIIELFENNKDKYKGTTNGGFNKNVKDTTDFVIPKNDIRWSRIYKLLEKELSNNVKNYINKYNEHKKLLFPNYLSFKSIQIQKYNKGVGKYICHHDQVIKKNNMRKITFIWYLNDITYGGETEFFDFKIKPNAGKLVLFPALWVYPHKANVPLSSDKYIMTGWLDEAINLDT